MVQERCLQVSHSAVGSRLSDALREPGAGVEIVQAMKSNKLFAQVLLSAISVAYTLCYRPGLSNTTGFFCMALEI